MRQAPLRGPVRGVVYGLAATGTGWWAYCLDCETLWPHAARPSPHAAGCPAVPVRYVTVREVPR